MSVEPIAIDRKKSRKNKHLLQKSEQEVLRGAYDLGEWTGHERTPKGHSNQSFFLNTSSGEYVIRRSSPRRKVLESLKFEVQLIDFLYAKGYCAPELMHTRNSDGYLEHEGLLYMITRRIPGGSYSRENLEHLREAGRALARYHLLVRDYPKELYRREMSVLEILRPEGLEGVDELTRCAKNYVGVEDQERLAEVLAYFQERLGQVLVAFEGQRAQLERTVIQGSLGKSALIFDGDRIAGVVDFDRASLEYYALDLAYTLKSFCGVHGKGDEAYAPHLDLERAAVLMDAYWEVIPISTSEAEAVTTVFQAHRLVKAQKKATNVLHKLARKEDKSEVISDLIEVLERSAQWVRWIETHESAIRTVVRH